MKDIFYIVRDSFLGNYDIAHFFLQCYWQWFGLLSNPFLVFKFAFWKSHWIPNKAKWYTWGKTKLYSLWAQTSMSRLLGAKQKHVVWSFAGKFWNAKMRRLRMSLSSPKLFYYFSYRGFLFPKKDLFKDNTVLKHWEKANASKLWRSSMSSQHQNLHGLWRPGILSLVSSLRSRRQNQRQDLPPVVSTLWAYMHMCVKYFYIVTYAIHIE